MNARYISAMMFWVLTSVSAYSGEIVKINEELNVADPEYVEKMYQWALSEFEKQAYEESLKYIRHVIKADMANYKLRYLAAHDHWKLGHYEFATTHFQAAISAKPDNPNAYMDLATMKIQERNYTVAEWILNNAMNVLQKSNKPLPSRLYNIYSRIQLMKGLPEDALKYAQLAKAAFEKGGVGIKDKLETMTLEARSQLLLENFEKAELATQWAIAMRKDNVYAHNLLGYIYSQWRQKIIATDAKRAEELKKLAAENFQKAKKIPHVVDEFKKIIDTNLANLDLVNLH